MKCGRTGREAVLAGPVYDLEIIVLHRLGSIPTPLLMGSFLPCLNRCIRFSPPTSLDPAEGITHLLEVSCG